MEDMTLPHVDLKAPHLTGDRIDRLKRTIGDLEGIFRDQEAYKQLSKTQVVYEVESYFPVPEGTEGGLFIGVTHIYPGKVGHEFFMTKGHYHQIRNRGEVYWGIEGEGVLIMMDTNGHTWGERIFPGSYHYIPGNTAHRTANTTENTLSFGAVWPADAGHDYDTILEQGFSKILIDRDGTPELVPA